MSQQQTHTLLASSTLTQTSHMVAPTDATNANGKRSTDPSVSPQAKRTKLTPEEKAAKEVEKEEKRKKQEEKKREVEERKRIKEEEKRVRDEERKQREEEKKQKEEEKRLKREIEEELSRKAAEEIAKKESRQLRMGLFFKKADPKPVPVLQTVQAALFKPFYLKENASLATVCRPAGNADTFSANINNHETMSIKKSFSRRRRKRGIRIVPLRDRLQEVTPVPLEERLSDIKYKLLQFQTDVRPAYFGTMTTSTGIRRLTTGRAPLAKSSVLNYDYDSEADWVEGDDGDIGEDLGDDDDASVVSRDTYGDDDDGFLDDEEDKREVRSKGYLLPVILGILPPGCESVKNMAIQKLVDTKLPIDPFMDYWEPQPKEVRALEPSKSENQLPSAPAIKMLKKSHSSEPGSFPESLLSDFKKAIQGSTLKKAILIEKLREDFKMTKKVVEGKLGQVAVRQGKKPTDVWVLL